MKTIALIFLLLTPPVGWFILAGYVLLKKLGR